MRSDVTQMCRVLIVSVKDKQVCDNINNNTHLMSSHIKLFYSSRTA